MTKEDKVHLGFLKEHLRKGLIWYMGSYTDEYVIETLKNRFKYTDRQINNLRRINGNG